MDKEKEILRQQLELLAEIAKKSDDWALSVTRDMCEVFNCLLDCNVKEIRD